MRKWINLTESTGAECTFQEWKPGEWWYLLDQSPPSMYDEEDHRWDWREDAVAEGPFKTFDEGVKHLHDNYANPGGYSIGEYREGIEPDKVWTQKMEEARERAKSPYRGGFRY